MSEAIGKVYGLLSKSEGLAGKKYEPICMSILTVLVLKTKNLIRLIELF